MPSSSPGPAAVTMGCLCVSLPVSSLSAGALFYSFPKFFCLVPATQEAFKASSATAIKVRKIHAQLGLGLWKYQDALPGSTVFYFYLKELKKKFIQIQQKWYCLEKVRNFIKENLIAHFLKRWPRLSILITVKCRMAVSKEGKMNEKRLSEDKSRCLWRDVPQETRTAPGSLLPLLSVRALG